ncbi:MAG: polyphosphate polymerase domain-containing protein [Bacteroidaceae bacterium]|nr:polyphosphate polymerase domain-containing protein [Bacteroidaceae bacterium]
MTYDERILNLLKELKPITLDEMSSIKLMNRLDTKYVTTKAKLCQLLELVKGKYYVQETNGDLISPYRTTYFDTPDHAMYMQHHCGHCNRKKVRVRTYLSSGDLTFLEVKNKNNHGRTKKKRVRVGGLDTFREEEGTGDFVAKYSFFRLEDLQEMVQNLFDRVTLVNYGKTERLTIDFNVHFHNYETGNDSNTGQLVIIELKRDGNVFSPICNLLRDLHIHPSGFSKYCIGTVLTNPTIKHNNFKMRVRYVSRFVTGIR